jgi:excisionase family DNA binding protein
MALLNIKDVSTWLNLKPSTVYHWAAQGKLPALRLGGLLRFRREDIETWLVGCQIEQPNPPRPTERRRRSCDVDAIIASAKRAVYTPSHGKPGQDRATRKGGHRGAV